MNNPWNVWNRRMIEKQIKIIPLRSDMFASKISTGFVL